ncbi:uncharacterized protein [Palaemon carinicauda]|uniref:uncharacterized protein n=1 Tax=Palaemon carinicauda TaxID=392227 RepID=UPI0035B623F1
MRPAMTYGEETWPMKMIFEKKINVAEMRMLRWMARITRLAKVRNYLVRGTTKVTEVSKKIQEKRLHWFEHVMRRDQEYVGRRMLDMDVPKEAAYIHQKKDGSVITTEGEEKPRWMEHFSEVVNRIYDWNNLIDIPEADEDLDVCTNKFNVLEVEAIIKKLKRWKAPGYDGITA